MPSADRNAASARGHPTVKNNCRPKEKRLSEGCWMTAGVVYPVSPASGKEIFQGNVFGQIKIRYIFRRAAFGGHVFQIKRRGTDHRVLVVDPAAEFLPGC